MKYSGYSTARLVIPLWKAEYCDPECQFAATTGGLPRPADGCKVFTDELRSAEASVKEALWDIETIRVECSVETLGERGI